MFIELVDVLRCPRAHAESWLVLSASRMRDRHVIEGELGCHVCQSLYRIRDGVAIFDDAPVRSGERAALPHDAAFRMAALLGLAEPGGIVLLCGQHTELAATLAELVADMQFLCINAPGSNHAPEASRISHLQVSQSLPLSAGSCRAAVVDPVHATAAFLADTARVLRGSGRLVTPANAALPDGVHELVRDAMFVVAQRGSTSGPLIPLQSSRRK